MLSPISLRPSTLYHVPELLEVESYAEAARTVVGRTISTVDAHDGWYFKRTSSAELEAALSGETVTRVRRIGKLMLIDTDNATLGVHFGMTGRIIVDGAAPIDHLEYSSRRSDPAWIRFALGFSDGGSLAINDPRRLGGVELDPDEDRLGPDATSLVDDAALADRLTGRRAVKAVLLDQRRVAGLGNLLVDEILWRSRIAPTRPADELSAGDIGVLRGGIVETIEDLRARGGSHTGDLQEARSPGAVCPMDGAAIRHDTVGGRSTYWCPQHQH